MIAPFRWTDAARRALVERWKAGETGASIAADFGVSASSVSQQVNLLRKAGVDLQERSHAATKVARAAQGEAPVGTNSGRGPLVKGDAHCGPGLPMDRQAPGACWWPVNATLPGEPHLFCTRPAEGELPSGRTSRFCRHHAALCYRKPV